MLPEDGTLRGGGGCPAVRLDQIADYEGEGVWRVKHRGEEWLEGSAVGGGAAIGAADRN